jgi:hypothetical protein
MPTSKRPTGAQVIAYDVGFGDCFLLRFLYPGRTRHVLIDFGSHPAPRWGGKGYLLRVANAIAKDCDGKLDAVVATHRHADHINGFARGKDGVELAGDVIRRLEPEVVVQPWTEHPGAARDAVSAPAFARRRGAADAVRTYVAALNDMQSVARAAVREAEAIKRAKPGSGIARELQFLGGDNIANESAVENLMTMARRATGQRYVHFGANAGLASVLPGVKVTVLGPPTLEQTKEIQTQRQKDGQEFWHVRAAFWATARRIAEEPRDAREARAGAVQGRLAPPNVRWLVHKLDEGRGRELLEIVRRLDDAMNNTSVVLLFEAGGRKMLFPGDAQYENWMYALSQPQVQKDLEDVDFYKVGHHGSLNGTPRTSLWDRFTRRSTDEKAARRLITLVSTEAGRHGKEDRNTEVPRKKLMTALREQSTCLSTQDRFAAERKRTMSEEDEVRKVVIDIF